MPRNYFTEEEIQELSQSKYVKKITLANVQFTEEFKTEILRLHKSGVGPKECIRRLGLNYTTLGPSRVKGLLNRSKAQSLRPEGFQRLENSSKGKKRKISFDNDVEALEYYKEYSMRLEQELEFRKKMQALEDQSVAKSSRAKSSK